MERFFEEECRVFSPDDPGLILLEDALNNADLKVIMVGRDVRAQARL